MGQKTRDYTIAVVLRTLDILEALADGKRPLGPTELARRVGTTPSAAFRILKTLEERGYVARDPITGQYRLGTRLAYLGERSTGAIDLRHVARPALEELHRRFRETVNLAVLDNGQIVYIDMIESDHGLRMAARVGARDYPHSTSLGKAILAYLPQSELDQHLQRPLPKRTPNTITDPEALRLELERVRSSGVAEDHEENEEGACCFGAPVFDHQGRVVAAISISGPAVRLAGPRADEIRAAVKNASLAVSQAIGGRVPEPVEG